MPLELWHDVYAWKAVGHFEDAHSAYKATMRAVGPPVSNQFIGWGSAILKAEGAVQKQWAYVNHPDDYDYPADLEATIAACEEAFAEMARFERELK